MYLQAVLMTGASLLLCGCTSSGLNTPQAHGLRPGERVLFQGDSITDGNRGRNDDPNHILGHGYAFILAADYGAKFPEARLSFVNRGISGNKVTDLQQRWKSDALQIRPTVLSILIGVNDTASVIWNRDDAVPVDVYERVYDELIAQTLDASPDVRLVLCEPFILRVGYVAENWDAWHADIQRRQQAVQRLAEKYHVPLVRFQRMFDEACQRAPADYWIWDGVHPTYSGHQLMADEWRRTVRQAWGTK